MKEATDAFEKIGKIYVKTYYELLTNALKYHKEFIERYEEIEQANLI